MFTRLVLLLLLACYLTGGSVVPLQRAHTHQQFVLPLRGSDPQQPTPHRLLLVAEPGHSLGRSVLSICSQLGTAFDTEGLLTPSECQEALRHSLRAARGLALQHEPEVAGAVHALESYLGEEGHAEGDWEGTNGLWIHPYKARLLRSLVARAVAAAGGGAEAEVNVCSVGFGTGHSALVALTGAPAGVRYFSFDRATGRAAIPAQDFLDARFPERNMLFLGEPAQAMQRFLAAFPTTKCALLLLDPNAMQPLLGNASAQALRGLAPLAAPDHALVLLTPLALTSPVAAAQHRRKRLGLDAAAAAAAASNSTPGLAWAQAEAAGWIQWEGTLLESPEHPLGDRVLYGAFTQSAAQAMRGGSLEVEQAPHPK
jgi:hypothetical protein